MDDRFTMSQLRAYDRCVVCGSKTSRVIATERELEAEARFREHLFKASMPAGTPDYMLKDLAYVTNSYTARLVQCKECGQATRDPRMTPETALRVYGSEEYHPEWMEAAFREYYDVYAPRMRLLARKIGTHSKVLEIGSFVGGFLAAARDWGWQAQGVDVGRCVSEFSRGKGLDVLTGTLEQAHLPDSTFDAVFIWVCFDQLPDPWETLGQVRRILKQGGRLVIQVPNAAFYNRIRALARNLPWQSVRERTLKLLAYTGLAGFPYQLGYTPKTLRRMLRRSGFSLIHLQNEVDLCHGNGTCGAAGQIPEQAAYLKRTRQVIDGMYRITWHGMAMGPWIEAMCRKGTER